MSGFEQELKRLSRMGRRAPKKPDGLDDEMVQLVLDVAQEFPRFTAEEVRAELLHGRRRGDITTPMVRYVFAQNGRRI